MTASLRHRFPGAQNEWARFDAPSGTQVVDVAIDAVRAWLTDGSNGCGGGWFAAADACDALLARARATVGQLLHADPDGVVFGPNMTSLTFAFSRAVSETLAPGDRIVGTRLDHDANVTPWRLAAERAGAEHVLAEFDPVSGTLDPDNVVGLIDERTRWVTVPGASNLLGTVPDLAPIIDAAHRVGARVFVDAVALAPHQPIDISALGCDVLVTSPYKWYAPHSGAMWIEPNLLQSLPAFKVRPSENVGPRRFETGMPSYEAIAGVDAAARFLLEEGLDRIQQVEMALFAELLDGLHAIAGVRIHGPQGITGRTPTVAFTLADHSPEAIARTLAADKIAVWDGNAYAVELEAQLGLSATGGVVRAGLARYIDADDVQRLLQTVDRLATSAR